MLQIRDLVKVYPGPVVALQDVSLDIPEGMFGLLGPNGAGKTTLMRILAGLLEPTSGSIALDGVPILDDPGQLWQHLGYLPQDFGFYPHLTGDAMLAYLLELKGVVGAGGSGGKAGKAAAKALRSELLERVNLTYAAKRKVKSYSGGMRQRLGIAQAVAGDPKLIIVDEPTAGLDPEERLRFYRILAELAENRTVILSTHIVEDVAVLCPRFAVIREGRVIARTTPSAARAEIDGAMFEGHVAAADLERLARELVVTQAILVEGKNRVRIWSPDGPPPGGFEPVPATLEDAYLVLMRTGAAARHDVAPEAVS